MRKVILDTNYYSAFKKGDPSVFKSMRTYDFIGLDVTVLAELYSGFSLGSRETENRKELEMFLNSSRVGILNHDNETADFYSHIYKGLRKSGNPIPVNDIWIAAVAMQHGLELCTLDRHFENVAGLMIRNH